MSTEKPNIVYIFSDQHRGDAMGCVGHPVVITPNLDRLSSESVTYERCSTNSPLCMPARASMMTGQFVREHGIWTNNVEADPNGPSHVRKVRNAGYHTALVGKTHLYMHGRANNGSHSRDKVSVMEDWGFVDTEELHGPLASARHNSAYTDHLAEKGLLDTHREYIKEYAKGWADGTAYPWTEKPCPLPDEDHLDAFTGRRSAEWIENYSGDKPFYLQVLFPGPHDPFDSPASYRDMYKAEEMPVGSMEAPQEPIPINVKGVLRWSGIQDVMTREQKQLMSTYYYAKITLIDEYIGRIMKALEKKDLLENTWIIYSSDHGEMLGDHMMSHKIVFYEGALRIPCIVRPPQGTAGWKTQALTDQLDLTASILDIAGATPMEGGDGRSLKPQVLAGADDANAQKGKEYVFSEVYGMAMIRNERYKMALEVAKDEAVELYDLEADPDENRNLIGDPTFEGIRQELKTAYKERMDRCLDKNRFDKCFEVELEREPSLLTRLK
ncbi:MAG: sulfatase-like hydrolase/transferase [Proteobacteria bacterium]|nr:sulfatase-like hydrolase/transferase [Pseudomonadota bacterium]